MYTNYVGMDINVCMFKFFYIDQKQHFPYHFLGINCLDDMIKYQIKMSLILSLLEIFKIV